MKATLQLPTTHLIGCGGVGSWLYAALIRLGGPMVHLWDADILEERNLDRQLFTPEDIGKCKADALVDRMGSGRVTVTHVHDEYFHSGSSVEVGDLLLCCADNHAARRACLEVADLFQNTVIIGGNEYTDADAYIYTPSMRGTENDPRVFAPEILTDNSGDPLAPRGCVGAPQLESPQLVIANVAAATHMLRLMWWWYAEAKGLDVDTKPHWPVMFSNTASRMFTVKFNDRKDQAV